MFLTALVATFLALPPCERLDLPTARALAAAQSDEVEIRRAEWISAKADESLAKAVGILPLATLTLIGGPAPAAHGNIVSSTNSNRSLRDLGPFGRVDINVIQPLWTWGQIADAKEAAKAGVNARKLLVEDVSQSVQLRVVQTYWGAALAKRLLSIANDVDKALVQVEQKIKESLQAKDGDISPEDRYRVAIYRSELLQRKAEAEKGLHLTRVALSALLTIPEHLLALKEEALPADPAPLPAQPLPLQVVELAHRQRPDLLALDQALIAKDAQVRAMRASRLPQFFLAGTFAYSLAPNRDIQYNPWIRDDFNLLTAGAVLGLRQNLSFPLMNAQLEKVEAELEVLKRQREGASRGIGVQVESAVADVVAAEAKKTASHQALSAGRSWFRAAELNFAAGVGSAKDLLEGYSGFVKTQIDDAQAGYELLVAQSRLDQTAGTLLNTGELTCLPPSQ